ncbi:hypothetical protein GCK72_022036 [Caenorhabditis remanei]|uniref:Major facilitator superfamily (MFS) profile domain-containing protein n=1 Tax=Caenorhabditis remanei TaxID=31234 RepID=A0A6A5GJJ7_CAERE|nr:hypothetical protein GCK72_022036 [Caenorhabditis remanei]KAF1755467.1 hypothetical protein GCK72_022036 [Caenorhabditis remanei]
MVAIEFKVSESGRARPEKNPKLGFFVYLLGSAAIIGGFLFGYDTSVVSAAMLYVPEAPGLKPMGTVWKEVIVSITPGMAAVGAWFSGAGSDRYGRKPIIIGSTIIFIAGAAICAVAWTKIVMLIGRIFLGVGIGFASMVVPVYLGEASPTHVRGVLVSAFAMMISFGQVVANVMGGIFSYWEPYTIGWRLMFAFAGIPALIQFVCFIFLPETPRWLYENGQTERAKQVLEKIYSGDEEWIEYELAEIETYAEERKKQMEEEKKSGPVIWRILKTPHVLKACFIGSMLQAFQQLAGINTILYYTADIIRSAGIENYHTIIWISVILSVCNLIGPFIPMTLIEKLGRRKLFLFSCAGVVVSLVLIGVSFLLVGNDSAPNFEMSSYSLAGSYDPTHVEAESCRILSNCDSCVTSEHCGFCEDSETRTGFCLPVNHNDPTLYSSTGLCTNGVDKSNSSFPNATSYMWQKHHCTTSYTILPIVMMGLYLLTFSSGFTSLPWVLNSEFYPMWARSTCVSISTLSNWVFNLLVSLTYLSLTHAITKYGAFWLYAIFTIIAFIFIYFLVPETTGYSIDEVEMLFMNKRQRNIAMQIRQAKLENGKDKDKETNNNSSNSLSTETITM